MRNNGHRATFPQPQSIAIPGDFDFQFRQHVLPDLQAGINRLAPFVARGDISFAEASDTIMAIAVKRGATDLADLNSLQHFLTTYLSNRIMELQP